MENEIQSVERDRSKKRDDPGSNSSGGSKVFELKKEKKRRTVVSDSESDEYQVSPCEAAEENVSSLTSRRWNAVEWLEYGGNRVEKEGVSNSDGMRQGEKAETDKKKVLDRGLERKRSREVSEDENAAKRSRVEGSKSNGGRNEENGENKMKASPFELGNEEKRSMGEQVPKKKPMVPAYRLKEATIQGIVVSSVDKASKLGCEEPRLRERLRQRTPRSSEVGSSCPAAEKEEPAIAKQEIIRVQGKGGVLRILPTNRKVGGSVKTQDQREDDERSKCEESFATDARSTPLKHTMRSGEKRVLEKLNSNVVLGKGESSTGKNSSSGKTRLHEMKEEETRPHDTKEDKLRSHETRGEETQSSEAKTEKMRVHIKKAENKRTCEAQAEKIKSYEVSEEKIRSPEVKEEKLRSREAKAEKIRSHKVKKPQMTSNNVRLSKVKSSAKSNVGGKSSLQFYLSGKENTKGASGGRNAVKQQVREQIKTMLLDAGWKIELRPRRGRDYEDAVYVSPQGTGYWSITKAYAVFQEQFKGAQYIDKKVSSGKPSKQSSGVKGSLEGTSPFSAIPMDALHMLKRNVVNKRRRRAEPEETRSNGGDNRKKKKKKGKDAGGKKKVANPVDSNAKVIASACSQKLHLQNNNNKQRGCTLLVRGANQGTDAESDDYVPYVWKRTVLSWMIDLGIVPANGKVKYMNKKKTRTMLEGRITRDGINCSCCSKVLTISRFEVHAGSKLNQPYENIYVEETGISLLQSQLNAWKKHEESERRGFYTIRNAGDDPNDDTCGICGDGGDLICCDSCPSTFHLSCLGIQMFPAGDWHCMHCSCKYCGLASGNAAEEIRGPVSILLSCSQCEEKYHQECVPEADAIPVSSNKIHSSFCGQGCRKVFKGLQKLIGVKNDLEAGFSWSLIHRLDEDSSNLHCSLPVRAVCNSKIAVAFAVMDECFLPITDQRSGINLIHNVLYSCGSNFKRLDYSGFYTFILERGDEIICVASVRIHGTRLAEMPFIGTRNVYRRQGMCRRLLDGIEMALCSLNIEKLIIPAISELANTWTTAFGFKPFQISRKEEIRSINMLVFPGTGLLEKILLKRGSAEQLTCGDGASLVEYENRHCDMPEVANKSSSFACMDTHTSNVVIAPLKCDAKEPGHSSPVLDGHKNSINEVTSKSSDASHESNSSDDHTQSKSETDTRTDQIPQPVVVYDHNHLMYRESQVDASNELLKFPSGGSVWDKEKLNMKDAGGSDEIFAPGSGSKLHGPACSLQSGTVAMHHDRLEGKSGTSSLPVERGFKSCGDHIVDNSPDEKSPVATSETNFSTSDNTLGCYRSDVITGNLDGKKNASLGTSGKPEIHLVDECTVHVVAKVKADESKSNVDDGDTGQNAMEIVNGSLDAASGKENFVSCQSCVSHLSDVKCEVVCNISALGSQVIDERSAEQDSQLLEEQPEGTQGIYSETNIEDRTVLRVVPDSNDATSGGSLNNLCDSSLVVAESDLITASDITPVVALAGGSSNSIEHTTLVAVLHDVTKAENFTVVPVETSHTIAEVAPVLEGEVHGLKPVQALAITSPHSASKAVGEPLDNGCEPMFESDANVVQHDFKFLNSINMSASCLASTLAGAVSTGEINDVVNGCKQATFLGPGHDSADDYCG